ncbi:hypothetical protein JHK82_054204 [Glycine max]|uniref:Uncharacterized protein n=2 Tax=Glycine subgen. Soja TaxID=1462606 RepID=A0A0R0EQA9_SOYBN|nr:hypothetical protein JHK86_054049 [Glycine max]RZB48875.1 hypothetical protein D0Y65_052059 [Glycine soja]KAG4928522.1 hypothetical protein JHK85_055008 [Glycine max]KAG5084038.1 hypothetical protein JHK84_054076 [Glycine max]KAG5086807.1 hypothetical protein JHK82_054204 [Glycine max]
MVNFSCLISFSSIFQFCHFDFSLSFERCCLCSCISNAVCVYRYRIQAIAGGHRWRVAKENLSATGKGKLPLT